MLPEINFDRFSHSDFVDSWDALLNGAYEVKAAKQEIDYFIEKMEYIYEILPSYKQPERKLYDFQIAPLLFFNEFDDDWNLAEWLWGPNEVSKSEVVDRLKGFLRPLTPAEQATEMGKRMLQKRLWRIRNQDWEVE